MTTQLGNGPALLFFLFLGSQALHIFMPSIPKTSPELSSASLAGDYAIDGTIFCPKQNNAFFTNNADGLFNNIVTFFFHTRARGRMKKAPQTKVRRLYFSIDARILVLQKNKKGKMNFDESNSGLFFFEGEISFVR